MSRCCSSPLFHTNIDQFLLDGDSSCAHVLDQWREFRAGDSIEQGVCAPPPDFSRRTFAFAFHESGPNLALLPAAPGDHSRQFLAATTFTLARSVNRRYRTGAMKTNEVPSFFTVHDLHSETLENGVQCGVRHDIRTLDKPVRVLDLVSPPREGLKR